MPRLLCPGYRCFRRPASRWDCEDEIGPQKKENYREEIRICFLTGNSSHVSGPSARTGNEHHSESAGARQHFEGQKAPQEDREESRPRGQHHYSKARSCEVIELSVSGQLATARISRTKPVVPGLLFLKSEDSTLLGASPSPFTFLSNSANCAERRTPCSISASILEVCEKFQPAVQRSTIHCPAIQTLRTSHTARTKMPDASSP